MGEPILEPGRQAGICVYDGTEWRKAKGNTAGHQQVDVVSAPTTIVIPATGERLEGFSGIVEEGLSNLNLAAGTNSLDGTPVPAGEIWKILNAAVIYYGTAPSALLILAEGLALGLPLLHEVGPSASLWYIWSGEVYLQEGDYMRAFVFGATAGDDLHFRYAGIKMAAP